MATYQQNYSRLQRLKESILMTLLGWIPTIALGVVVRKLLYPNIFAKMGSGIYIQDGVEFLNAACIEIGNNAHIFRGVRIDGKGENNRIHLGSGVALEHGVDIGGLDCTSIEIGDGTFIGPYTCIGGPGNIKIGKDCLIAAHSGIFANNHKFADPLKRIRHQGVSRKGIVIEDDCWLGHKVTILDGVIIGRGSVIGAGAVVTKDIPPYSIAVGVPAKVIAKRDLQEEPISSSVAVEDYSIKKKQPFVRSGFTHTYPAHLTYDVVMGAIKAAPFF